MGSSGNSRKLVSLRPPGRAATEKAIRSAILETLSDVWFYRFPSWGRNACNWIDRGEDSLLTIEVHGGDTPSVMFWSYDSVEWPSSLASHWLDIALAMHRRDFELALGKIGIGLDLADWPEPIEVYRASGYRFFEHAGVIGRVFSRNEDIEWQMLEFGMHDDFAPRPFAELEPEARAKAEAVLRADRCACPVCMQYFPPHYIGPLEPTKGAAVELVRVFHGWWTRVIGHVGGSWLVAPHSREHAAWTLRSPSIPESGATIDALSDRKRLVDYIRSVEGSIIAQLGASSGTRFVSRSEDGGATWSAPTPTTGLPKLKYAAFFTGEAAGIVYAVGRPAKELYRSIDGGLSFELAVRAPTLDGNPIKQIKHAECHGEIVLAILQAKGSRLQLGRSSDGWATFEPIAIPGMLEPSSFASPVDEPGVVGVVGGGSHARSEDRGDTWSVHAIAAGAISTAGVGQKNLLAVVDRGEAGVYESTDGGRTWARRVVLPSPASGYLTVHGDPTGSMIGLLAYGPAVHAIRSAP